MAKLVLNLPYTLLQAFSQRDDDIPPFHAQDDTTDNFRIPGDVWSQRVVRIGRSIIQSTTSPSGHSRASSQLPVTHSAVATTTKGEARAAASTPAAGDDAQTVDLIQRTIKFRNEQQSSRSED